MCMRTHTTICASSYCYSVPYYDMCVLNYCIYVLILLHLCPLTNICVSSYYYMCVLILRRRALAAFIELLVNLFIDYCRSKNRTCFPPPT
jgi:hypothetical protein